MTLPESRNPDAWMKEVLKAAFDYESSSAEHPIEDEDLLLQWANDQLPEAEREELLDHLAKCSDCRKAVAGMVRNDILVFHNAENIVSLPSATDKIAGKTKGAKRSRWLGIASLSLLGMVLLVAFIPFSSSPIDDGLAGRPGGGFRGTAATEGDKFALLVGIDRYANLPRSEWLDGCGNDIGLVRSMIVDRFDFPEQGVSVLLNEQATSEQIRNELRRLVECVRSRPHDAKPAQVVFYFSGHGSRTPDQPEGDPDCDAPDGYDSTLVVYDSKEKGGENDIRDDELNKFAREICQDGRAELLVALDSCHSGGGIRGITKFRGIDRNLERPVSVDLHNRQINRKEVPDGTIFLSACRADQREPEFHHDGKTYGLFTFHLVRLLETPEVAATLDYVSLKNAIYRVYLRKNIFQAPIPTVEGKQRFLERTAFGTVPPDHETPCWEVERDSSRRDAVRFSAGRLQGMTERSLFELYETVEQAVTPGTKSIGWLAITETDGVSSKGEFFQWNDDTRAERVKSVLPKEFRKGFAVRRYHDHGKDRLDIRVVDAASGRMIPQVRLEGESDWIRWVDDKENCDLIIRLDAETGLAAIFSATGCAENDTEPLPSQGDAGISETLRGGWGPVEWKKGKRELVEMLGQIYKGLRLKRLIAEKNDSEKAESGGGKPKIRLSLFRQTDGGLFVPVDDHDFGGRKGIVVEGMKTEEFGPFYQLRMTNLDTKPVYLTVLCIDPDMRIDACPFGPENDPIQFDPDIGSDDNPSANRLSPGKEYVSVFGFNAPFGVHSLIVIATHEPGNFSRLAQPGLTRLRGGSDSPSSLADFLDDQCLPGTRAIQRPRPPRHEAWSIESLDVISRPYHSDP